MPRAPFVVIGLAASLMLPATAMAQEGVCAGQAWISGDPPAKLDGPDFTVYKFRTATGVVGVYVGSFAEVAANPRTTFTTIDGVDINRTTNAKGFSGYLVEEKHGGAPPAQLHFFGDGLKGDDGDRLFFQRVHFGKAAAERCKKR